MSFSYGEKFKVTIFGQSHSPFIGVVIDGVPSGIKLDIEKINAFMSRRAPGKNELSTSRIEADIPEIVSGTVDGITCGAPLCALIKNENQNSSDYEKLKNIPRPSHADFSAYMKHNGFNDIRGGGSSSGRMTAPLCFAGAVAMQILEGHGIFIGAHIQKIHDVNDRKFDCINVSKKDFETIEGNSLPVLDKNIENKIKEKIKFAKNKSDSVGGIIECAVIGLNAGIGEPMFDGIENEISKTVFAVPAVKGIEFGNGFECAELFGSENNDSFCVADGKIKTETNNHGGILGGISSGMPIIFRVAIKPTPSIGIEQDSVNLETLVEEKLKISGRHDPCIVPRAVPCVEAATAVAIINLM